MELNVLGGPLPEAPAPVASAPGQLDLLSRLKKAKKRALTPAEEYPLHDTERRKCTRCYVIYSRFEACCSACKNPEFEVPLKTETNQEATNVVTKTLTKPKTLHKPRPLAATVKPAPGGVERILLDIDCQLIDIVPGLNPRTEFDPVALAALADSIRDRTQLAPIGVRPGAKLGRYELMFGERRFRAIADNLGLSTVWCRVINADEELQAALTDDENITQAPLNAIERAESLQRRFRASKKSQKAFAESIGISQGELSNRLRLLELPPSMRARIISGEIAPGAARSLVPFADLTEVVSEIEADLDEWKKEGEEVTIAMFRDSLLSALRDCSRTVIGGYFDPETRRQTNIDLSPITPALRKSLDIRDVPQFTGGTAPRAFNLEAWDLAHLAWQDKEDAKKKSEPPPIPKVESAQKETVDDSSDYEQDEALDSDEWVGATIPDEVDDGIENEGHPAAAPVVSYADRLKKYTVEVSLEQLELHWDCTADFLEFQSDRDLLHLAREWKLKPKEIPKDRDRLIKVLLNLPPGQAKLPLRIKQVLMHSYIPF